jgi:selenide,water dikinase
LGNADGYRLREHVALVQSVDLATPTMDDTYRVGRVAAPNAFTDTCAIGSYPISIMHISGFPIDGLGQDAVIRMLQRGTGTLREADATLVAGHSSHDTEPEHGLATTGLVDPTRIITSPDARAGHELVLSPLAQGVSQLQSRQ